MSHYPLTMPILPLSQDPKGPVLALKDFFSGVQIFGGTGSGKTSGSGATIAKNFLHAGFGGLILTVKDDERGMWEKWITKAGRRDQLAIIDEQSIDEGISREGKPPLQFAYNFLAEEMKRPGGQHTENLVHLLSMVIEIAGKKPMESGDNPYFALAAKQLMRNAIELLKMADETISVTNIYRIIVSAPTSKNALTDSTWQSSSYCFAMMDRANDRFKEGLLDEQDYEICFNYYLDEFPDLSDKTRSGVTGMVTSAIDPLLRGTLRRFFSTKTNIRPEKTTQGLIILIDLNIKEYSDVGRISQSIYKLMWQRAMERRNIAENDRPVFLWVDECQHFLNSNDMVYQQTARSKRGVTVFLTQNREGYQVSLGGEEGKTMAESILGNLALKIFHANSSPETNEWAARIFGQHWKMQASFNSGDSTGENGSGSTNKGRSFSKQLVNHLEPNEFTTLLNGGPDNDLIVSAIIHQAGRQWAGDNTEPVPYYRAFFDQRVDFTR